MAIGMRRVDERQRDERTAVLGPARQCRQAIEAHVGRDVLGDRTALHASRADLQQLETDVARAPQLGRCRRQQRLGQLHDAANQPERPLAERQLRASSGAEQVRDEAEAGSGDVGEEQRRAAGGDDASMDLGGFEMAIDGRVHRDDVAVTLEEADR